MDKWRRADSLIGNFTKKSYRDGEEGKNEISPLLSRKSRFEIRRLEKKKEISEIFNEFVRRARRTVVRPQRFMAVLEFKYYFKVESPTAQSRRIVRDTDPTYGERDFLTPSYIKTARTRPPFKTR